MNSNEEMQASPLLHKILVALTLVAGATAVWIIFSEYQKASFRPKLMSPDRMRQIIEDAEKRDREMIADELKMKRQQSGAPVK